MPPWHCFCGAPMLSNRSLIAASSRLLPSSVVSPFQLGASIEDNVSPRSLDLRRIFPAVPLASWTPLSTAAVCPMSSAICFSSSVGIFCLGPQGDRSGHYERVDQAHNQRNVPDVARRNIAFACFFICFLPRCERSSVARNQMQSTTIQLPPPWLSMVIYMIICGRYSNSHLGTFQKTSHASLHPV